MDKFYDLSRILQILPHQLFVFLIEKRIIEAVEEEF